MPKIDLEIEEEEGESKIVVESGSKAIVSAITSQVINPIPTSPSDMVKMLALGKIKFVVYEIMVNDLVQEANQLVVSDQETHNKAVELGLRAKKKAKEIKEKKESLPEYKFAKDLVKGLDLFTKPFTDGCDQIERITKDKNRDWMAFKELERRKQQKILEEAQKEVQAKVDAEAEAAGVETVQIQPAIIRQEEKVITRTQAGSAHLRASKDFKILNLSLVPKEYLERAISGDPDKFLRPVIRAEIKENPEVEIPGIMIFDSTDIVYRS